MTASNAGGSASAASAPTSAVGGAVPANLTSPQVSGTARDGEILTADDGTWSPGDAALSRTWQRCDASGASCADIAGAISATYTLKSADVGKTVRVMVTATNGAGSASKASAATGVVAAAAAQNTVAPSVSGTAVEGQTLTADPGTWSGTTPMTPSYQWQVCDATGASCTDIAGANGAALQLNWTQADRTVRVRVAMANPAGSSAPVPSAPTGAVAWATPKTTVLSEDFETGLLAGWTNLGLANQQATVFRGAWAGRALASGTATWAHHPLNTGGAQEVYERLRFRSAGPGWPSSAYITKLRGWSSSPSSSGTSLLGIYVSSTGATLTARFDLAPTGGTVKSTATGITAGEWHDLGVHAIAGPSGSLTELYLDGKLVLSDTTSLGTANIGKVQLGDNTGSRTFDLAFDDLIVQEP